MPLVKAYKYGARPGSILSLPSSTAKLTLLTTVLIHSTVTIWVGSDLKFTFFVI